MMLPLTRPALSFAGASIALSLCVTAAGAGGPTVYVEPSQTLVRQAVTLDAGGRLSYPLPLIQGTTLHFEVYVDGGLTQSVAVGLVDQDNFDKLKGGTSYEFVADTKRTVWGTGKYTFLVPRTGTYHLLVDNGAAWFLARDVDLYAYVVHPKPTPWSLEFQHSAQGLYNALRAWFLFDDFKVSYRHCGVENAFSSPDITICLELIEGLRDQGLPGAYPFVLFHELGHTLLRRWGDTRFDQEDVADEFAVMASVLLNVQSNAAEAAKWFAARKVEINAGPRLWLVDRHTISPVRAQNIIGWLKEPSELMRTWQPLLVPHMQTDYLKQLDDRTTGWVDHAAIRAELKRRASHGRPPDPMGQN